MLGTMTAFSTSVSATFCFASIAGSGVRHSQVSLDDTMIVFLLIQQDLSTGSAPYELVAISKDAAKILRYVAVETHIYVGKERLHIRSHASSRLMPGMDKYGPLDYLHLKRAK